MSEIASCSYEARAVGVRNGMFLGPARKLCPDIHCVPYQFEEYRQVSQKLYDILVSYSHEIEAVSCDEAYIDVSETLEGMNPKYFGKFKQRERQKRRRFRFIGKTATLLVHHASRSPRLVLKVPVMQASFLVHFFAVAVQLQRKSVYFHVLSTTETKTTTFFFFS